LSQQSGNINKINELSPPPEPIGRAKIKVSYRP
jgi:hypothetical protein